MARLVGRAQAGAPMHDGADADARATAHTAPTGPARAPVAGDHAGPAPARIGKYRVIRRIASGGMGQVFECADDELEMRVAIKVAHPRLARDPEALEAVREEGKRLARVKDRRYVLRVKDAGETEIGGVRLPWVATEFEEASEALGGPRSSAWTIERKVALFAKLCEAVASLHEQHLVHADIKPSNVLVVGEEPRLIDFGIARAVRRFGGAEEDFAAGTPAYMDPVLLENADARPDQRSDVYALGMTLAVFLTGREVKGERGVDAGEWPSARRPPSEANGEIDAELDSIILSAIGPDASQRPAAAALGRKLEEWRSGREGAVGRAARRVGWMLARTGVRARRRPALASLAAAAVAAALLALASPAVIWVEPVAGAFQRFSSGKGAPLPGLGNVCIIRLDEAGAFAETAGIPGFDPRVPGGLRPAWTAIADALAEAGSARVVGFDLIFKGESRHDAAMLASFDRLARATEAGCVVVGLDRWRDGPPASFGEQPRLRAGCVLIAPASDHPALAEFALQGRGEELAYPSFALLVAALGERPGFEPRFVIARGGQIRVHYSRRDASGVWVSSPSVVLGEQQVDRVARDAVCGHEDGDELARLPVRPPGDAVLERATLDAAEVVRMPVDALRSRIAGKAVVVCAAMEPGGPDRRFEFGARAVAGADLHATVIGALLERTHLRIPTDRVVFLFTLTSALIAACAGVIAARSLGGVRNPVRGLVLGSLCVGVVMATWVAVLYAGAAARYVVNPVVACLAAAAGFVITIALHTKPAHREGAEAERAKADARDRGGGDRHRVLGE